MRLTAATVIACVLTTGCSTREESAPHMADCTTAAYPEKVEARGLHNVHRVSERLFSGSSPEGDEGFRSVRDLGIRTIITVDGAKPDVDRARRHGLRYVHLPIGYDGVPEAQGAAAGEGGARPAGTSLHPLPPRQAPRPRCRGRRAAVP